MPIASEAVYLDVLPDMVGPVGQEIDIVLDTTGVGPHLVQPYLQPDPAVIQRLGAEGQRGAEQQEE